MDLAGLVVLALVGLVGMILTTVAAIVAMAVGGGPETLQTLGRVIAEIFKHLGR